MPKVKLDLPVAKTRDEEWSGPTPALIPDGGGGYLLLEAYSVSCPECGSTAEQRMCFVCEQTKRPDLVKLGVGSSVKHYYTSCDDCGACSVS